MKKIKLILFIISFSLFIGCTNYTSDLVNDDKNVEDKNQNEVVNNQELDKIDSPEVKETKIVTLHFGEETQVFNVEDTFTFEGLDDSRYEFYGLYVDDNFTTLFDGIINDNIDLYVKYETKKYISYYVNHELIETKVLLASEVIPDNDIIYNTYYDISVYSDIDNTIPFIDYQNESDCSLFYDLKRKDEFIDKVVVNIHAGNKLAHYVLDKGDSLSGSLGLAVTRNYSNLFTIYTNESCTEAYKFGPINDDIDLYVLPSSDEVITSDYSIYCNVVYRLVYPDRTETINMPSVIKGTVIKGSDFPLRSNDYISGVYSDSECTIPFVEEEAIDNKLYVYAKVDNNIPETAHKVTIYDGPSTLEGIDSFNKETATIYREFYVRDGAKINEFRQNDESFARYYIYYANDLNHAYENDVVTSDLELVVLNDGLYLKQKYNKVKMCEFYCLYEGNLYYLRSFISYLPNAYDIGLFGKKFYIDEECTIELTSENCPTELTIIYIN